MIKMLPLLFALAQEPVDAKKVVATVLDRKITAGEVGLKSTADLAEPPPGTCSTNHPVDKLQELVWRDVSRHFVEAKGLQATAGELKEMSDSIDKSTEERRKHRAKETEEVEKKLRSDGLSEEERKTLETRAKTLRAIAENDQWQADHPEEARKSLEGVHRPWIEASKLDHALYKEFGGVVAITKFGQVPVGARAAMLRRYAKDGKLTFADPVMERQFWAAVEAKPRLVATPDQVDLTPFWKRR